MDGVGGILSPLSHHTDFYFFSCLLLLGQDSVFLFIFKTHTLTLTLSSSLALLDWSKVKRDITDLEKKGGFFGNERTHPLTASVHSTFSVVFFFFIFCSLF